MVAFVIHCNTYSDPQRRQLIYVCVSIVTIYMQVFVVVASFSLLDALREGAAAVDTMVTREAREGGYDLELFVEEVADEFVCTICMGK